MSSEKFSSSEQYGRLVEALNKTVEALMVHRDKSFQNIISQGISYIADAADLDAVAIYSYKDADAEKRLGQVYLWHKEKGGIRAVVEELALLPDEGIAHEWAAELKQNRCISRNIEDMTADERDFLDKYNVKNIIMVPVFSYGEFWGSVAFQNHKKQQCFHESCNDLFRSAAMLYVNAIIREEVIRSYQESYQKLEQHKKMIEIINETAMLFLSSGKQSFDEMMNIGITPIADRLKIDRVSIWRNKNLPDGLHISQMYRWDRASGGTTKPETEFEDVAYSKMVPQWEETLKNGNYINSPVDKIPEQSVLEHYGIESVFVIPIFIDGVFWGGVLFEDRQRKRYFKNKYIEILQSAAILFTNAVIRNIVEQDVNHAHEMLKTRLTQRELLSEISKSFVTSGKTDILINQALTKVGLFLKTTRIRIYQVAYEYHDTALVYQWVDETAEFEDLELPDILAMLKSVFTESVFNQVETPTIACNDVSGNKKFRSFVSGDIDALICAPIYQESHLWGVLCIEQCDGVRKWQESEITFIARLASIIESVITQSAYNNKLAKALQKMTSASEAKGLFLSNMSHEMRTPLNTIMGMSSIGKKSKDIERKEYALDKIEEASSHLLGVINDVLDMSKIEANKLELVLTEFSFEKMLKKTINAISFRSEQKQQKLKITIDGEIPHFLCGDDQRLSQVIINLLSNAVKFTPEGGTIHLKTHLLAKEEDYCIVKVEVSDTGIGISKEQQEKLFHAFEQADSSMSRKFGGTGLGLVISKRIVEMMGGDIQVKSTEGQGSTFSFTFQAMRGKDNPASLLDPSVNWSNMKVLAVDDEDEILTYLMEMFKNYGLNCDIALSGQGALEKIDKYGAYDIYFIDWRMPGMDGIELTRHIKKDNKDRKSVVIMISATEWELIREEAEGIGVDKYLMKPLFASDIVDCINACLGSSSTGHIEQKNVETGEFKGCFILLAEDVEINSEILLASMEGTGVEIDCAENGIEAVRLLEENQEKYDLIFMDIQMPEMDGLEATRQIRQGHIGSKIPIIAMTANVFKEDIEKCMEAGMNDHLGKPLDISKVYKIIRKYWKKGAKKGFGESGG